MFKKSIIFVCFLSIFTCFYTTFDKKTTNFTVKNNHFAGVYNYVDVKRENDNGKKAASVSVSEPSEGEEEVTSESVDDESVSSSYRLTSFWANDGYETGSCTGSGLCTSDFNVNDKGWYTYQGKLVLAGATSVCLKTKSGVCGKWNEAKEGRIYFDYYDVVTLNIDGVDYEGIVLDTCGASMYLEEERLDLFVAGEQYAIDGGYNGHNMVEVRMEE